MYTISRSILMCFRTRVFSFFLFFFVPLHSLSIKRNIKSIWIEKEASVKKRAVEISFTGKISKR